MPNELPGRASAVRWLVSSLEHDLHPPDTDAETRAFLAGFVPAIAGVKPYVPVGACPGETTERALVAAGTGFSVASLDDVDQLPSLDVDPRAVIFRTLDKARDDARDAALRGVWRFAIRSESELMKIAAAAPGAATYVRLDVHRIATSPDARSIGASANEALRLLRIAPECGLRPYGLAFHVGATSTDSLAHARAIERCGLIMRRLEQFGTRIEMLGMGGGIGPSGTDPVLLAAIGRLPYRPPLLVAEP